MLREMLEKGEFAITCEFVPGRGKNGPSVESSIEFAKAVAGTGANIHAVSLTDNPGGNSAMVPDALAPEIQKLGMDALVHFSCRDMNRNAVESRVMALARAGINNLLVITGDYPASGFEGNAAGVFDLDSVQAIKYMKSMNAGIEVPGPKGTTARLPQTNFFIAAGVSPFKLKEEELLPQYFKMEKKIKAGADFIITQLGYDMRKFLEVKRYMDSRGLKVPLVGNVYVLSYGAAKTMNAGLVPGCVVTDELVAVLEAESKEADKGKKKRLERAAKMVAMFKGMGFAGVHIGGFGLKTDDFLFITNRAKELEPQWEEFIPEVAFSRKDEFYAFPPPKSYRPGGEVDADPVKSLPAGGSVLGYSMAMGMHKLVFEREGLGCKLMTRYYKMVGERSLMARLSHFNEHVTKLMTFNCRDCGDCALPDMAYCCPQGKCAKQQRNGPCGGSTKGMCEVYPDEKPCVWTLVYPRLKGAGKVDEMRTNYVPPRKMDLANTSGWYNYFLNKDHAAVAGATGSVKKEGSTH